MSEPNLPALLQRFFTDRLLRQLGASPHTVAGYRDTFRLLLRFVSQRLERPPCDLQLEQLDASILGRFLDHLELERHNATRTRNTRLAALRAFFHYVAVMEPAYLLHCQRVLAIPGKRYERGSVEFLTKDEATALLAAPDTTAWIGLRDRTLLLVGLQTGLRNSELRSLRGQDVEFGAGAHVKCLGKGRKMRCTPLRPDVAEALAGWTSSQGAGSESHIFPNSHGTALSADALQRLVARHATTAATTCPSLKGRTITPHTLRHTAAMDLLQRGVDLSVIALWLGHESTETTQMYIHANMRLKEQALAHASPSGVVPDRFRPEDSLLAFLEAL